FVLVLLAGLFAAGCGGGYVGRARRDYSDGRYLEAAERLGQHESELDELSPRRQAGDGVYRGLSLLMLGDFGGAHRLPNSAYEVERQNPGTLKTEQRADLDRGWAQLAQTLAGGVVAPGVIVVPAPRDGATPPAGRTPEPAPGGGAPREELRPLP